MAAAIKSDLTREKKRESKTDRWKQSEKQWKSHSDELKMMLSKWLNPAGCFKDAETSNKYMNYGTVWGAQKPHLDKAKEAKGT